MTHAQSIERARSLAAARERLRASLIGVFARSRTLVALDPADWELLAQEVIDELTSPTRLETLRILGGERP